jgi:hypothetical protein
MSAPHEDLLEGDGEAFERRKENTASDLRQRPAPGEEGVPLER